MELDNIVEMANDDFLSHCVSSEGEQNMFRKSQEIMFATTDLFATMHVLVDRFAGKPFEEAEEVIVAFVTDSLNESCKLLKEIRLQKGQEKFIMERLLLVKLVEFIQKSLSILEESNPYRDLPEPESIANIKTLLLQAEKNSQMPYLKMEYVHNMNGGITI